MSIEAVDLRLAKPSDLAEVSAVEEIAARLVYTESVPGLTREVVNTWGWGTERARRYDQDYLKSPRGQLWVAEFGGSIVGFAAASMQKSTESEWPGAWLRKLYLMPDMYRRGIGSALLERAETWLMPGAQVLAEVSNANTDAQAFYENRGYESHYQRPDADTIIPGTNIAVPSTVYMKLLPTGTT
jgi:GNAT superfamily N-acetyltransferase